MEYGQLQALAIEKYGDRAEAPAFLGKLFFATATDEQIERVANYLQTHEEPETYTITRLDTWDDNTWSAVIEAVEETTASYGETGDGF